ncbi:MAG TPA: tyrosinase family protein, partial [Nakamurella sp.]
HGTYLTNTPSGAPWNQCQHATWYFVPWHRMYLFQFENILRSLLPTADQNSWALPFWDYSSGSPGNALPPAFRVGTLPDHTPNPLFVPERRKSVNDGVALPDAVTSTEQALADQQFPSAAQGASVGFGGPQTGFAHQGPAFGQLEAQPHGPVHVQVGGNGGLMTDPNTAASDPIFWLHHANIDRLWEVWNIGGGANPAGKAWLDHAFPLRDATGAAVRMKPRDVLDTVSQLDYTYESLPVRAGVAAKEARSVPEQNQPLLIGTNDRPIEVGRHGATTTLAVTPVPDGLAARATAVPRMYLNVTDIEGTRNPGVVFGVYLNLPDPPDSADDTDDPGSDADSADSAAEVDRADRLAGLISFFGIEDTDPATAAATRKEPHGMRYSFDVTDVVNRLRDAGSWRADTLRVTLLPVTPDDEPEGLAADAPAPVRVGTFNLYQG